MSSTEIAEVPNSEHDGQTVFQFLPGFAIYDWNCNLNPYTFILF